MWHLINLLFLAMCFFTKDICCDDFDDDAHDSTDNHVGYRGPPIQDMDSSHERPQIPCTDSSNESPPTPDNIGGGDNNEIDNANPEGHILIVVIPVICVVLLVVVTGGICIIKKYNHDKIKTRNYQDMGITEKHPIAFTSAVIYPDNPHPCTPTMEDGERNSVPPDFLGFGAGLYTPEIANMPPSNTKLV